MRTRSMIEAWSVGALRASWPANSPAALPQQGIRLRNASRQRPEVSGGELFLLPRGFFALLAQGLTNLMPSLPFSWPPPFRPDSVPGGVVWLPSGSYKYGSDRPLEWPGERLGLQPKHTQCHDLDSLPESLDCLASTRLLFLLDDQVTHQWDGGSPDRPGSFQTDSHAEKKSHQCPDTRLMPSHHLARPSCGARSCCEKSLSLSDRPIELPPCRRLPDQWM